MYPWKRGFLLSFNDCLYLSASAWMLASFSLIWGPNFCLQTFCCWFLHSFFLPHTLSLLAPPPSFSFLPAWLAVFVSLHLNFAHLLSALMEGDIWRAAPSAAHGAGVAAAAHLAGGGMQSGEIFVKQRDYMIAAPRRHSRRSLWSRKTIYNQRQQGDSEVVKPDVFCVQARIFVWNMD